MRFIDRTGKRYGRLTVQWLARVSGRHTYWSCRCDCGSIVEVSACHLSSGSTQSCGCLRRDRHFRHGHCIDYTDTSEYRAYQSARARCTNPNRDSYKHYGGRGIKFLFSSFEAFFSELGPKPTTEHEVDRIDNDGNYESGNVRWATHSEQMRNRRRVAA